MDAVCEQRVDAVCEQRKSLLAFGSLGLLGCNVRAHMRTNTLSGGGSPQYFLEHNRPQDLVRFRKASTLG